MRTREEQGCVRCRCRRCADARARSLLRRPCTEWLPPPHPHAAAHARHSSRPSSQRSKPLMCSLSWSSVLLRRHRACCWGAAETGHLAPAPRQPQPARSHQQRAARASHYKHTHKQSGPTARRARQPASRTLHVCTRGVDTHSLLSVPSLSPRCCCNSCCWPLAWQCCSTRAVPPHCSLLPS